MSNTWQITSTEGDHLIVDQQGVEKKVLRPHSAPTRSIQNTSMSLAFNKSKNIENIKIQDEYKRVGYNPLGINSFQLYE